MIMAGLIDIPTVGAAIALMEQMPDNAAASAAAAAASAAAAAESAQSVDTATVAETKSYLGIT